MSPGSMQLITFTALSLIAFSANSIFCRLALGQSLIDPASFTALRLFSGAVTLAILLIFLNKKTTKLSVQKSTINTENTSSTLFKFNIKTYLPATYLLIYALFFSYAYTMLDTGTGALILFGAVQLYLIGYQLVQGESLNKLEWLGVLLALSGFIYLVLPSASAPSFSGLTLMLIAGVAWALYTLSGRGSRHPTQDTASNFAKSCILFSALTPILWMSTPLQLELTFEGASYSLLSGIFASAMGYALWYKVLPQLSITSSAVLQLLVPILAAWGGVLFVDEIFTSSLIIASSCILGGITLVIIGRRMHTHLTTR